AVKPAVEQARALSASLSPAASVLQALATQSAGAKLAGDLATSKEAAAQLVAGLIQVATAMQALQARGAVVQAPAPGQAAARAAAPAATPTASAAPAPAEMGRTRKALIASFAT